MRTETAFEGDAVVLFKNTQAGVEQLALRDDDDIEPRRNLVSTEDLSYKSFSSVSGDGAAEFSRRRDAQASDGAAVWKEEQRRITPVDAGAALVDLLKLDAATDVLVGSKPSQRCYSLLTVRRLRPLARRRFNTSRPFFVLMRTRNPCVFARWRVFGWNVLLPFMECLSLQIENEPPMLANGFR